jgi:hypothetical protein
VVTHAAVWRAFERWARHKRYSIQRRNSRNMSWDVTMMHGKGYTVELTTAMGKKGRMPSRVILLLCVEPEQALTFFWDNCK